MSRSFRYFALFFAFVSIFFIGEVVYLSLRTKNFADKRSFVKLIALPDLAISTEAKYIRHRSLSDIGSVFSEDPESQSYFATTFVYAPSNILNITPNKIIKDAPKGNR